MRQVEERELLVCFFFVFSSSTFSFPSFLFLFSPPGPRPAGFHGFFWSHDGEAELLEGVPVGCRKDGVGGEETIIFTLLLLLFASFGIPPPRRGDDFREPLSGEQQGERRLQPGRSRALERAQAQHGELGDVPEREGGRSRGRRRRRKGTEVFAVSAASVSTLRGFFLGKVLLALVEPRRQRPPRSRTHHFALALSHGRDEVGDDARVRAGEGRDPRRRRGARGAGRDLMFFFFFLFLLLLFFSLVLLLGSSGFSICICSPAFKCFVFDWNAGKNELS